MCCCKCSNFHGIAAASYTIPTIRQRWWWKKGKIFTISTPKSDEGIEQNRTEQTSRVCTRTRIFLLKSVTNEKLQLRLEKRKKRIWKRAFMCETGYQVNAYQVLHLIIEYWNELKHRALKVILRLRWGCLWKFF